MNIWRRLGWALSLFLFPSFAVAADIQLISYGNLSTTMSGELLLLIEDLSKDPQAGLQIVKIDKGVAHRKGDIYLLTKDKKAGSYLDSIWKGQPKAQKTYTVFETGRSLLTVEKSAPPQFLQLLRSKKGGYSRYSPDTGRFWDGLSESQAAGGELSPGYPYYLFHRENWRNEDQWHFSFYMTYILKMQDIEFRVDVMPKEYGGLWRLQSLLQGLTGQKNQILLSTGDITPSIETKLYERRSLNVLNQFGTQYVTAGASEIIGKKLVIDHYRESWNGQPPVQFLSANVYEKLGNEEIRLFKPYEILQVDGKKLGVISLSSPELVPHIEKAATRQPWLKNVIIKEPEEVFEKILFEVRPQVDFVILLTNLTRKELGASYPQLEGVDLVIQRTGRIYTPYGKAVAEFKNYKSRLPRQPMMIVPSRDTYISVTDVELDRTNAKLTSYQRILDQSVNSDGASMADYDDFSSIFSTKDVILPDHRQIYPDKIVVAKEEFANLAAEMMRKQLDGEIGIFNIQNQNSDMPGELDASILNAWIREEEQLMVIYLLGRDISELIELNQSLEDPHRLAFAGIDKKGMFSGIPLQPNEVYRVITSTAIGDNSQFYPPSANAVAKTSRFVKVGNQYQEHIGGEPVSLTGFLTQVLKTEWKANSQISEQDRLQKYRDLYESKSYLKRKGYWVHDFKSIRLEYSTLKTTDLGNFQNVVDSRLNAADQRLIGAGISYAAIYRKKPYISELGIKGQFAKVEFNPDTATEIESVMIDDLVYFANIGWPVFPFIPRLSPLAKHSGPIFEFAYDTEFEKDKGTGLEKNLQSFLGWRFYDGDWFKSITLAALNENRLTEGNEKNAWGYNARFEIAKAFRAGLVVWRSDFDFRYFFNSDNDTDQDLQSRMIWDNYLDLNIFGKLSFGPYFKWATFSGQTFEDTATQTTVGINFNFSTLWKPKFQKTPF